MIDEVADVVSVNVSDADGGQHTVRVLPTANKRAKLSVEMTSAAIDLLSMEPALEAPPDGAPPTVPADCTAVRWMKYRHAVAVHWWGKEARRWRIKSMIVKRGPNIQERVLRMSRVLQEFWVQHHSDPDADDEEESEAESARSDVNAGGAVQAAVGDADA